RVVVKARLALALPEVARVEGQRRIARIGEPLRVVRQRLLLDAADWPAERDGGRAFALVEAGWPVEMAGERHAVATKGHRAATGRVGDEQIGRILGKEVLGHIAGLRECGCGRADPHRRSPSCALRYHDDHAASTPSAGARHLDIAGGYRRVPLPAPRAPSSTPARTALDGGEPVKFMTRREENRDLPDPFAPSGVTTANRQRFLLPFLGGLEQ